MGRSRLTVTSAPAWWSWAGNRLSRGLQEALIGVVPARGFPEPKILGIGPNNHIQFKNCRRALSLHQLFKVYKIILFRFIRDNFKNRIYFRSYLWLFVFAESFVSRWQFTVRRYQRNCLIFRKCTWRLAIWVLQAVSKGFEELLLFRHVFHLLFRA